MRVSVPRPAHGCLVMLEVAGGRGLSEAAALTGTGLTRADLLVPEAKVTKEQETTLACNIVRGLGDEVGLGAEAGMHYTLETFGVWGYALRTSTDVRSALRTAERFLELTYVLSVVYLSEVGGEARLMFDVSHLPEEIHRFALERDGMAMRIMERQLLGRSLPLTRIETAARGTAEEEEVLSQILQAPVTMNSPESFGAFDRALLDEPIVGHHPRMVEIAIQQCEAALAAGRAKAGHAGSVRAALLATDGPWTDISSIAEAMHISERTLQRRLIAEGTSFREIVAETREDLAVELLETGMPVAEVAQRVGYVEVSSFSQAFQRWRGVRPSAYRAQHADGSAPPAGS